MPQNSTVVSGAPALPQAPGKLAECAHLGINIHTDSWPPGLPSPISDYKVKSILFTDGGGAGGEHREHGRDHVEAENHLVQIKTAHSGPLQTSEESPPSLMAHRLPSLPSPLGHWR